MTEPRHRIEPMRDRDPMESAITASQSPGRSEVPSGESPVPWRNLRIAVGVAYFVFFLAGVAFLPLIVIDELRGTESKPLNELVLIIVFAITVTVAAYVAYVARNQFVFHASMLCIGPTVSAIVFERAQVHARAAERLRGMGLMAGFGEGMTAGVLTFATIFGVVLFVAGLLGLLFVKLRPRIHAEPKSRTDVGG